MKKTLGVISVDSGQLMIGDPCYLYKWKDNAFNHVSGVRNKDTGETVIYRKDVSRWDVPIERLGGRTMNDLSKDDSWERFSEYPDKGEYNYSGACGVTCDKGYGVLGNNLSLAVRTMHGDGGYPIEGIVDSKGRVRRIIIEFDEPEYILFGTNAVELYMNGVDVCDIRDNGIQYKVMPSTSDWLELLRAKEKHGAYCTINYNHYEMMREGSL